MSYSSPGPITSADDVQDFDCGQSSLNEWLHKYALGNERAGASRCFVTSRGGRVVGYYALSTGSVLRMDGSPRITRGMPDPIPIVLLGRLAVDREEQGHGLGGNLLRDAIIRTVTAADVIGVRAMLVHALNDEAPQFYLHNDFDPSPTDPMHLLLLMNDARRIVRGI